MQKDSEFTGVILVGNVGCGKSTEARKWAEKGYLVFNNDSITTMFGGNDYKRGFNSNAYPCIKNMQKLFVDFCVANSRNFVMDNTNMVKGGRLEIIGKIKNAGGKAIVVDFGPGTEVSLSRRMRKPRGYPKEQWQEIHNTFKEMYEDPMLDDGIDTLIRLG